MRYSVAGTLLALTAVGGAFLLADDRDTEEAVADAAVAAQPPPTPVVEVPEPVGPVTTVEQAADETAETGDAQPELTDPIAAPPKPLDLSEFGINVKVDGDERFQEHIHAALELLRDEHMGAFALVNEHVGIIRQAERSGMFSRRNPPVMELADVTTFASLTWCASTLAHEARHSMKHAEAIAAGLPGEQISQMKKEQDANAYQLEVLLAIGAPKSELDHLAKADGMHFDLDGDGRHTWSDYEKRDW